MTDFAKPTNTSPLVKIEPEDSVTINMDSMEINDENAHFHKFRVHKTPNSSHGPLTNLKANKGSKNYNFAVEQPPSSSRNHTGVESTSKTSGFKPKPKLSESQK